MLVRNPMQLLEPAGAGVIGAVPAGLPLGLVPAPAGGFAVSSALRLASEESTGRAEPILSTGIARSRWSLSHIAVSVFGTVMVLAAGGLGMGVSFAAITDEPPPEVAAAGHDRCIIPIRAENVDAWLSPDRGNLKALYAVLDDRERPYYEHRLAA